MDVNDRYKVLEFLVRELIGMKKQHSEADDSQERHHLHGKDHGHHKVSQDNTISGSHNSRNNRHHDTSNSHTHSSHTTDHNPVLHHAQTGKSTASHHHGEHHHHHHNQNVYKTGRTVDVEDIDKSREKLNHSL